MLRPAIQDRQRWWSREDILLLVLFAALFFLPGLARIPLFDRDEPRFATAAREMAQTHDFIVPHFNGDLRPDKPPLVYWLMNAVHLFTGSWNELTARLPSAICGTLTLLVVYLMTGSRMGRVTGLIAALMLGSCGTFVVESRLATADATMLFFITVCMACAWQAWDGADAERGPTQRAHAGWALLFWVALAGGTLAKGVPLIFVFVPMIVLSIATGAMATHVRQWRSHLHVTRMRIGAGLAIAVIATVLGAATARAGMPQIAWLIVILGILCIGMALTPGLPGVTARCITGGNWRWWRNLRPAWGIPLLILLLAAWVVPAGIRSPLLLKQMVGIHFLQRSAGPLLAWLHINMAHLAAAGGATDVGKYHQPPGYYLATVWATFWPWSVLLVPAGYYTVRRLRGKTAIAVDPRPYQFLVAWIVPMWILLEAAVGKLPHYTLPTFVGLAILCADALVRSWQRMTDVFAARWFAALRWIVLAIWCGIAAAVLIAARRSLDPELFWRCIPLAGALVAAGVAATIAWNRPSWPFVTVLGWGAALLFASTLLLPEMPALQVSERVAARMNEIRAKEPDFQLAAVGPTRLPGGGPNAWISRTGYQEPSLVFYAGSGPAGGHVRMGFPTGDDTSVEDMLTMIPFAPARIPTDAAKYLIAVDDPTLHYLLDRRPAIIFYQLGRFIGFDTGNGKPVAVTLISNVLPHEDEIHPPHLTTPQNP